jgi:serine/threonine-protein kinase ULK/ATG1
MALEVFTGKKQSLKADIWSLGILLYEIIYGYAPFRGRNIEEIMD